MVYREATEGAAAMILRAAIMTIRYGANFSVLSVNSMRWHEMTWWRL
jgi:hypothetical protein